MNSGSGSYRSTHTPSLPSRPSTCACKRNWNAKLTHGTSWRALVCVGMHAEPTWYTAWTYVVSPSETTDAGVPVRFRSNRLSENRPSKRFKSTIVPSHIVLLSPSGAAQPCVSDDGDRAASASNAASMSRGRGSELEVTKGHVAPDIGTSVLSKSSSSLAVVVNARCTHG